MKLYHTAKDLTGQRFGRLVVIAPTERRYNRSIIWLCECDCGNKTEVTANNLLNLNTKSCGCLLRETAVKNVAENKFRVEGTNISHLTQKLRKNNTSGHKGVCWDKRINKWRAEIMIKGKSHYLGSFENIQDAIKARKQGEEELFEPLLEKYDNIKGGDANAH